MLNYENMGIELWTMCWCNMQHRITRQNDMTRIDCHMPGMCVYVVQVCLERKIPQNPGEAHLVLTLSLSIIKAKVYSIMK